MFALNNEMLSYLMIDPCKGINSPDQRLLELNRTQSLLYSKEYSIISLTGYSDGVWDKSYLAFNENDNDLLRQDAIFMLTNSTQNEIIIKYKGESQPKMISKDGSEALMSIQPYSDVVKESKIYILDGYYFSFKKERRYRLIESKNEISKGMTIEYFNNDKWNHKIVSDVDTEFEKMYKLLIKYNKLRVEIN